MSGEQKTKVEKLEELSEGRTSGWLVKAKLREENAALKAALSELIKISSIVAKEDIHGLRKGQVIAAIDRARALLDKQPQSESHRDKNL